MFGRTTAEQFTELFEHLSLGDRRPSELLAEMPRRAGGQVTDTFLEPLWLSRLPDHVSAVVSALEIPLPQKGRAADKIVDKLVLRHQPVVAALQPAPAQISEVAQMKKAIEVLTAQVAALSRRRERSASRTRSSSRRQSRDRKHHDTCWFHERFGDQARKCEAPCRFQ